MCRRGTVLALATGYLLDSRCRWPAATASHPQELWSTPDRGSQYTSWIFGHRLREAGLLGSMGRVASSVDNTMMESFWSTMQRELLDRQKWATRDDLASAIFEWIEGFYNPVRRHTSIDGLSPVEFEHLHNHAATAA